MNNSRTKKTIDNFTFGLIHQIVLIFSLFITRTIFIKTMSLEYLGINGLFTNILSILSIAELGFDTAIIYSMYKPLSLDDKSKVSGLANFYQKTYKNIAILIGLIGIAVLPFVKYMINTDINITHIYIYYLLFLIDSVISYLFAGRYAILNADQKGYILKIIAIIFEIFKMAGQAIILIAFKNFILFLIIQILSTLLIGIISSKKALKMYPFLRNKDQITLNEKKSIIENVKSVFIYRIGGVVMNNTDNILISMIVGTIAVGYYANYLMIISGITRFTQIIFNSVTASVGNLNTSNDREKQEKIFDSLVLLTNWLFGFCSICLIVLMNDFITLWIGEKYILSYNIVIIAVLNFYIFGVLQPQRIFRDTTGLFKHVKYIFLLTAFLNLILSIILGKIMGLFGILLATAISRLLTNFWYEPHMLYKLFFNKKSNRYFTKIVGDIILTLSGYSATIFITSYIKIVTWPNIIIKLFICLIVPNLIYFIAYRKSEALEFYEKIIKKALMKTKVMENE